MTSAQKAGGKNDQVYTLHHAEADEGLQSLESLGISYSSQPGQSQPPPKPRKPNPKIYKQVNKKVDNSRQILNLSDLNVKYHALDSKY